ncbi:hypothetical protein HOLleu_29351 [Holothuria leucospilota]|uniref:Uncharacterized protein n=1 Tax=Holothuria leucospilota TaxID=206669 RepID=A0A9Q1BNL6_HOLLE|nr:hypothetical protein HOLleu_29351 [Holothuria leucospilota]
MEAKPEAAVEPKVARARLGEDVLFTCNQMDNMADNGADTGTDISHTGSNSYLWEASPLIIQENRYELIDGSHVLRILDLKQSDNNTEVVCHIEGITRGGKARIQLKPSVSSYDTVTVPSSSPFKNDDFANVTVRNGSATASNQLALPYMYLFIVGFAVIAVVLILAAIIRYRKSAAKQNPTRRKLRAQNGTISRENSYQSTRFEPSRANPNTSKARHYCGALPELPVTEFKEQEVYAVPGECESNTVPTRSRSKRYLSPPNNSRRTVNGGVCGNRKISEQQNTYECMDANTRLRNCVSQPNLDRYQERRYVNWKDKTGVLRFSAPYDVTYDVINESTPGNSQQTNQNANTRDHGIQKKKGLSRTCAETRRC